MVRLMICRTVSAVKLDLCRLRPVVPPGRGLSQRPPDTAGAERRSLHMPGVAALPDHGPGVPGGGRRAIGSAVVSGTGFLFSREIMLKAGGWPFHSLSEDTEFTVRSWSPPSPEGAGGGRR